MCDKHILVFESDDWGMCGIRDQEGLDALDNNGYSSKKINRAYYTLETAEDIEKLYAVLLNHKDSLGNHPVFTMNFVLTNPDFKKISDSQFKEYFYIKLSDGLPDLWKRRNLFKTYLKGINLGIVYPGYHGKNHINHNTWNKKRG